LVDAAVATAIEDQLREDLIAQPPAEFAAERRISRLADVMAESEGKEALCTLAEDDEVMLALFVGSVGETRAQNIGAAAVEVTMVLGWDRLALYLGEEMLKRRTTGLLAMVQDQKTTTSPEEQAALDLAASYAAGNRPKSSFDRVVRLQATMPASGANDLGDAQDEANDRDHSAIRVGGSRAPSAAYVAGRV
jgi:hypothetical protein